MKPLDPVEAGLSGTVLIEASAGTGKTYTIATLFLRLLLERRLEVSQILVVTYTRAATAELRERIRRRLFEAVATIDGDAHDDNLTRLFAARAREGQLAVDRELLLQALRDFDQAAIFTIHAFCQHTLSECAFESGTPFERELTEDQAPLLREVALDYFAHLAYAGERELVARLRSKHIGPDHLALLAAKAVREPHMPVLPDAPAEAALDTAAFQRSLDRAVRLWEEEREAILGLLENAGLSKQSYKPERMRGEWARALDRLAGRDPGELPDFLPKLSQRELAHAAKRKPAPTHAFFEALDTLCACDAELTQVLEGRVLALRRQVVDYARHEVGLRRRERGVHSFDDLLHELDAALAGEAGDLLARRIAERHPAALIDEFQDTDPVQYRIFRRIYEQPQDRRSSLFLIGDPKQAIYGFRGADVFAYMDAARSCTDAVYTLGVNYRTDPCLIRAVGTLFGSAHRPFLFREIRFEPVLPKPDARERLSPAGPALQLLFVPRDARTTDKNLINKGWGEKHLPELVAGEILHLLHAGATVQDVPIAPRHVAVLCRTNAQAKATQAALAALCVPSVLEGDSSVFDSETAEELSRVLWAVAQPADTRKLGAALATAILGVSGEELHRVRKDETGLEPWLDRFARWNQTWHERGFVQMLQRVLDDAEVQPRLLSRSDGERRLTDLLHLAELLHEASVQQHLGPLSLLHWFSQARNDPEARAKLVAESEQMRLEHDEHAVRLTTVHRSKGLEYPVVFCPFAWSAFGGRDTDVRFHDREDQDRIKLDLGSAAYEAHKQAAQREELAESLRLLYVALTRAKHRCYLVWGRFYKSGGSALAWLLHAGAGRHDDPAELEPRLAKLTDDELRAELGALCSASQGSIGLRDIRFDRPAAYTPTEQSEGELSPRTASRSHPKGPRMTSFSRLTADAAAAAPAHAVAESAPDHDADAPEAFARETESRAPAAEVTLAAFPSGSRAGSLIHGIYEHIDFQRSDPAELEAQAERFLSLYGVDAALHRDALVRGIAESLQAPLDAGAPPLTLSRIARSDRVNELEFTLCTAQGALSADRLADALRAHGSPACDPGYSERLRALGFVPQAGFLKGFVDLVFRHDGRFYVADYKSNWLGEHARNYRAERMASAMREHHYYLQYHLYVLALHRYLSARLPDYDYDRHMGGVYYLFVRGMSPAHPAGSGVFFDRPKQALIEALAHALGTEAAQLAPEASA